MATTKTTSISPSRTAAKRRPPDSLQRSEAAQLRQLEDVIDTAKRWAIEEAKALYEIQQRRLYRADFDTYEEYVACRWGYDRTQAYRLAQWGRTLTNLSPIGDNLPERESHARPLYPLKPDEQRRAWRAVLKQPAASRTAAGVEEAVRVIARQRTPQNASQANYEAEGAVICADAIDGLNKLADQSVDLVLFSPPYCEQRKDHFPSVPETDFPNWMARVMDAIRPKLVSKGNVLIVAREHVRKGQISDVWLKARLAIRSTGWLEADTLIWHKPDAPPVGNNQRPRRAWEYVFWFSLSPKAFVDTKACGHEAGMPGRNTTPVKVNVFEAFPTLKSWPVGYVARVTNHVVAHVGTVAAQVDHPAMMPQMLADQLVRTFSPAGGLVADPFMGSGTTLLAARDAGRNWWGCDLMQKYVDMARRRLGR